MFASSHYQAHPVPWSVLCRWAGRVTAVALVIVWSIYAIAELFHPDFYLPPQLMLQGAALAVVFAGYAVGWRAELAGGLLVLGGMAGFYIVTFLSIGLLPQPAMLGFAAPGVLYLVARQLEHHSVQASQSRLADWTMADI
jgi:hypothetical protein